MKEQAINSNDLVTAQGLRFIADVLDLFMSADYKQFGRDEVLKAGPLHDKLREIVDSEDFTKGQILRALGALTGQYFRIVADDIAEIDEIQATSKKVAS